MKDKTNWEVTTPRYMTHLVADDYSEYLFGKALCGIKFQKGNTIQMYWQVLKLIVQIV